MITGCNFKGVGWEKAFNLYSNEGPSAKSMCLKDGIYNDQLSGWGAVRQQSVLDLELHITKKISFTKKRFI